MNKFEKLAQANVDHYNNHPVAHTAIAAVYGVVALVVIGVLCKKIGTMGTPESK